MPRKNNVDFVSDLMNFSPYGAVVQIFILGAVEVYAKEVLAGTHRTPAEGLISQEVWEGVAKDLVKKLEKRDGRSSEAGDHQSLEQ